MNTPNLQEARELLRSAETAIGEASELRGLTHEVDERLATLIGAMSDALTAVNDAIGRSGVAK